MTNGLLHQSDGALISAPIKITQQATASSRLLYIDNIRSFLTILVLLHHIMITYAGSGSWIYTENRQDLATEVVGSIFCTVNQAFFMGLFLFISAYFVPGAYDRKSPARFWKDRMIRLGIPLAMYSWLVHPLLIYWYLWNAEALHMSYWNFFTQIYFSNGYFIGQGPLWFVETLLIFTLFYIIWRLLVRRQSAGQAVPGSFPSNQALALFSLGMALAGFLIRLEFPNGWNFTPINLQLPFFAQYVFMFCGGLLAYRGNWLANLPDSVGRFWLRVSGMVLLMYIPGALLGGALVSDLPFRGGWTWQSLYYSLWEAYICLGLSIGIIYLFRRYFNSHGNLGASLSRNAYAAYLIQAPVITVLTFQLRFLTIHPLLKFGLAALVAVPLCFYFGGLLRRLPLAERVI
jgi:glucans biosynthesis protein C